MIHTDFSQLNVFQLISGSDPENKRHVTYIKYYVFLVFVIFVFIAIYGHVLESFYQFLFWLGVDCALFPLNICFVS